MIYNALLVSKVFTAQNLAKCVPGYGWPALSWSCNWRKGTARQGEDMGEEIGKGDL